LTQTLERIVRRVMQLWFGTISEEVGIQEKKDVLVVGDEEGRIV
jgi:hypothetical protein